MLRDEQLLDGGQGQPCQVKMAASSMQRKGASLRYLTHRQGSGERSTSLFTREIDRSEDHALLVQPGEINEAGILEHWEYVGAVFFHLVFDTKLTKKPQRL